MDIVRLTADRLADLHRANEPFEIIGRIKPSFQDGKWSYIEEMFEYTYWKSYPDGDFDVSYLDSKEKVIFLAYTETGCVGQIVLRKDWNRYAFVEDIGVAKAARGQGIGTALLQRAIAWAKASSLCGLALETQDNNLLACRFYAKSGFEIGAVNTMFYKNFKKPWCDEIAIFWYLHFE